MQRSFIRKLQFKKKNYVGTTTTTTTGLFLATNMIFALFYLRAEMEDVTIRKLVKKDASNGISSLSLLLLLSLLTLPMTTGE